MPRPGSSRPDTSRNATVGGPALRPSPAQWRAIGRRLGLSDRETDVTRGLFDSKDEAAVAAALGISRHTVHAHVKRIYRKVNVHSRAELLRRVFEVYVSIAAGGSGH